MHRASGCGLGLASIGTALQLVGLSWDALLHHFDSELAAREEVVSLGNPSHLLVVLGLALTALGVTLVLVALGWPRHGDGHRGRVPLAAAALLLALFGGMAGVGLATGGLSGQHQQAHLDSQGAAASTVLNTPTFAALQTTLHERGTPAALDQLEAFASNDQGVLVVAHEYAHGIGKLSLDQYGSAQQAFGLCRETFQSGCYHGVLEAYLERNPRLRPAEIATLCDRSVIPGAANALRFQCLHGLGHGLTANAEHDIFRALRLCDALDGDWDRGSCYSGVFMENIIFATHQVEAAAGASAHDHGSGHKAYLDASDPLYPCNVVDERYKRECFVMQTSAMLLFNGHSFPQAMVECDRTDREYVQLCYQSIGRDISSDTYRDPAQALRLCLQGQAAYRGHCLLGAAKNMIDVTWRTDQALELCGAAPADDKPLCYNAIGEQLANLYPEPERRVEECARVEHEYHSACASGAGLPRTG
jgi:hypothetical protein